jgi:DNA-binding IclR family transcriptional regulator
MNTNAVNIGPRRPVVGPPGVGLLVKAFQILDLFTEKRSPWTQAELARETGLARSTLSRLVRFLVARGFLMEQRGRYVLGFAAIDLGRRAQLQFNLVDVCYDLLEEAAEATGETVILTGYDESRSCVVCLAQIPSRHGGLRVFENIGNTYPLYAGASSKAVLAFLPKQTIERVLSGSLAPINPAVRFNAKALRGQLGEIRQKGYVVTREETFPGVCGVGAPVLSVRGRPLGSVAMALPLHRTNAKTIAACAKLLIDIEQRAAARVAGTARSKGRTG